jgi:hypothetical protein
MIDVVERHGGLNRFMMPQFPQLNVLGILIQHSSRARVYMSTSVQVGPSVPEPVSNDHMCKRRCFSVHKVVQAQVSASVPDLSQQIGESN